MKNINNNWYISDRMHCAWSLKISTRLKYDMSLRCPKIGKGLWCTNNSACVYDAKKMWHASMMLKNATQIYDAQKIIHEICLKYAVLMMWKLHKCIMSKMLPNESVQKSCKHIWYPKKLSMIPKNALLTCEWMTDANSAHLCDAQKWAIKYV